MINVNILADFLHGENAIMLMHSYILIINVSILIYYQIQQSGCQRSEQLHSTKYNSFRHCLILDTSLSWLNSILEVKQRAGNVIVMKKST